MIEPIHTALISGHPVRFFALKHNNPPVPWVSLVDICGCVGLGRTRTQSFAKAFREAGARNLQCSVEAGTTTTCPRDAEMRLVLDHEALPIPTSIGSSILNDAVDAEFVPDSVIERFRKSYFSALRQMYPAMSLEERIRFSREAQRRADGARRPL